MKHKIVVFALLLVTMVCNAQTFSSGDYSVIGSPMPPLLLKTKGKLVTDKQFKKDANLFVMLFSPICTHCEDETKMLENNIGLFKKSKIVLVAGKLYQEYFNNFLLLTHAKDYPMLTIGVDSNDFFKKTMLYDQLPQMNIYDHNRKLIKTFTGDIQIDSLKPYIE
jgi:thiol-disulfide isomerase/thioredoxin